VALPDHDVAELSLAPAGRERAEWAAEQMPVLATIRRRFAAEKPLSGYRIGASLHVTPETAVLLSTLAAGGAELFVCASNPLSTNDAVAAHLVADEEISVFARRGEDPARYLSHVDAVLAARPKLTVDDGCDLVGRLHLARPEQTGEVVAGTEDTSTGAVRLRALSAEGRLSYPVIALSSSLTRSLADNRHGTGQSVLDGIVRATNVLLAGADVVVAGYGNCGKGVASRARGLGAVVTVTEVDPRRALEAAMDGFSVRPMAKAAKSGEIFITATGNKDVLSTADFLSMRDGALLANAGQLDAEIDLGALASLSSERRRLRPLLDEYVLKENGRRLRLLAEGRLVNLAAADGHPPQVMDISFGLQALCLEWLATGAGELPPGVHEPPGAIDEALARLKLEAMGLRIDALSPEQLAYLGAFET
jgi:adenosylhomocysteinase